MLLITVLSRAIPFLLSYADVLTYPIIGMAALAVPAWRWRTRGLLPAVVTPGCESRLACGERMLMAGHMLFVLAVPAPFIIGILLKHPGVAYFGLVSGLALPLCLGLWGVGLYRIGTAGQWPTSDSNVPKKASSFSPRDTIT